MSWTVVGGGGFIGTQLVRRLEALGETVWVPARGQSLLDRELGRVVWCAGVTADFRSRPVAAMAAHVGDLVPLVERGRFQSLLYLSSTRVYKSGARGDEAAPLAVDSADPDDLYNLSKLAGESLVLASGCGRVARLGNVYGRDLGSHNFLAQLIGAALSERRVVMRTAPGSCKDYVAVDEVVEFLVEIVMRGQLPIYNVASGVNLLHRELVEALARVTGCAVEWTAGAPEVRFPEIDVQRLRDSFGRTPAHRLTDDLPALVRSWNP
jgi:nucleoside-diphosphate-sugar epimerase